MNNDFVQHALSWGTAGELWLKRIPDIIKEYEEKWNLRIFPPYNLTYNYVAPALTNKGDKVVLKIGFPQDKEFQTEISALTVFNGDASIKILELDINNSVILLEQVIPGTPLSAIADDEQATRILAAVMKRLWKPADKKMTFPTVKEWATKLFKYPARFNQNKNLPIPLNLAEKAIAFFSELDSTKAPLVLTHADLHHGNVLASNRDEWLSIDPKGIVAEPAYETAAMIRNPYHKLKNLSNIKDLISKRIKILSDELEIDPRRIYKWCFFQTVLSGVWTIDSSKDTTHALNVAHVLAEISI
jgi:streptomycin 6-kinase